MSNTAEHLLQPEAYANELGELNRIEAVLAELRARHGNVPDYTTKAGYEAGKASIKELTKYRTGTDKARLAITKPHRDFIEQVNRYAKGLMAEVEKLERPHRDAKQEVDEAEKRRKEERIAKLHERLAMEVTSFLDTAEGLDSNGLAELIEAAEAVDTEGYFDITKEAEDEKARVLHKLKEKHGHTLQREQLDAEREELEREKAELARLRAQAAQAQAQAEPASPAPQEPPAAPAKPIEEVAANPEADAYGEAMADLEAAGLSVSQAVAAITAIQAGKVRHITFTE